MIDKKNQLRKKKKPRVSSINSYEKRVTANTRNEKSRTRICIQARVPGDSLSPPPVSHWRENNEIKRYANLNIRSGPNYNKNGRAYQSQLLCGLGSSAAAAAASLLLFLFRPSRNRRARLTPAERKSQFFFSLSLRPVENLRFERGWPLTFEIGQSFLNERFQGFNSLIREDDVAHRRIVKQRLNKIVLRLHLKINFSFERECCRENERKV